MVEILPQDNIVTYRKYEQEYYSCVELQIVQNLGQNYFTVE
jgi:hypothetical protein